MTKYFSVVSIFIIVLLLFSCNSNNSDEKNKEICIERKLYEGDDIHKGLTLSHIILCKKNYAEEEGRVERIWKVSGFISNNKQDYNYAGIVFKIAYWDDKDNLIGMEEVNWNENVNKTLLVKQFFIKLTNSPPSGTKRFRFLINSAGYY